MGITDLAVDQSVLQSCCLIQAVVLVLGIRENINCCSFSLYFLGSKKFPLWVVGFLHSLYSDEICVSQSNSSDFTLKNNPLVAPRYFIPRNWVWMEQGQFYIICRYLYSPHFGPHWTLVGGLSSALKQMFMVYRSRTMTVQQKNSERPDQTIWIP